MKSPYPVHMRLKRVLQLKSYRWCVLSRFQRKVAAPLMTTSVCLFKHCQLLVKNIWLNLVLLLLRWRSLMIGGNPLTPLTFTLFRNLCHRFLSWFRILRKRLTRVSVGLVGYQISFLTNSRVQGLELRRLSLALIVLQSIEKQEFSLLQILTLFFLIVFFELFLVFSKFGFFNSIKN